MKAMLVIAVMMGLGLGLASCSKDDNAVINPETPDGGVPGDGGQATLIGGHGKVIPLNELFSDAIIADGSTLTGTLDGEKQPYKISIADGATVTLDNVTINGVHIMGDQQCLWAGLSCEGDATLILADSTVNTVKNFNRYYPCIHVPAGHTLTIQGYGSLVAVNNYFGAGIGGGFGINCGNIVIKSGTVTATGGGAAGIGSGFNATCGDITIESGTVTATGGLSGAGIGCGYSATCGDIFIESGTVTATGGDNAAGIGGGENATYGDITIESGTVTATGGSSGAGIGCGYSATCGDITIIGGTVLAQGGYWAAGIGCGCGNKNSPSICGNISINISIDNVVYADFRVTAIKGRGESRPIGISDKVKCDNNLCGIIIWGGHNT